MPRLWITRRAGGGRVQRRPDGKHEVATVLQRVDLADRVERAPAHELQVTGFADDTLVARAASAVATAAGVPPHRRFHTDSSHCR